MGDRVAVGGLAGIAIGFKHIHVALELEADYAYMTGSFRRRRAARHPGQYRWCIPHAGDRCVVGLLSVAAMAQAAADAP